MPPTVANGQPAAVTYHRDGDGTYHALGIAILTVTPAGITRITVFGGGPGRDRYRQEKDPQIAGRLFAAGTEGMQAARCERPVTVGEQSHGLMQGSATSYPRHDPHPLGEANLTGETVESPVRREAHAGSSERHGETDRQQYQHRAPCRLNHRLVQR